jgi:hypothetical protein
MATIVLGNIWYVHLGLKQRMSLGIKYEAGPMVDYEPGRYLPVNI